ncbi:MAG: alpha/beta hydrolase [candidate division Zixibacteria bacterium]
MCLHSSAGSSRQWQPLIDSLAGDYRIVAPDLIGYGDNPVWSSSDLLSLSDEVEHLRPALESIGGPFHLVAHSYGATVAFRLCHLFPERIRSLVVYEPVLFSLLAGLDDPRAAEEIKQVQDDSSWLLAARQFTEASRRFVDYWSGEGSFDRLPKNQQEAIEKRMGQVMSDFDATFSDMTPLSDYKKLSMPILFLYGLKSPKPTQRIAQFVSRELPNAEVRGFLPLGHMGPITHETGVQKIIAQFIRGQPVGILAHQVSRQSDRQMLSDEDLR